jgi:YVTN family beta-propeller protein
VTTDSSGNSSTSTQVTPYSISNAGSTASATWAPDSSKAYVVTGSKLVIRSGSATPSMVEVGQVNDVDFLAQGSFAYLGGGGADMTVRATCDNSAMRPDITLGGTPAFVRSLPNASAVLALYPNDLTTAVARYLNPITVSTTGAGCPPAVTNTPASASTLLGIFKPGQVVLLPDSSKAFITATDSPTVYSYTVASGNVTPITLTGSGATAALGAGVTVDSATLYVGVAGTNDLHVIDTSTNADTKQISIGFQPDLVAVKPK